MSESEEEEVDNTCEIFKSKRGGLKLYKDGYTYTRNKQNKNVVYWMCHKYNHKIYKCLSTVNTTVDDDGLHTISKQPRKHNHGPDPAAREIAEFKQKLKENSSSELTVCTILQNVKAETNSEIIPSLPSTTALKQIIYRQKIKNKMCVDEPTDISFELNASMTQIKGANFVIKDRIYDTNKRILLMSTLQLVKILSDSNYWILDGTYTMAPLIFQQMYTIHGNVLLENNKTFPMIFCLSTHNDKQTYDLIFELLLEYGTENNIQICPKVCILDFEKPAILSLQSSFENIILKGCDFHFSHIIYRRIQRNNMTKKYATDPKFNLEIKCLIALAYLEHTEIPLYFQRFMEYLEDEDSKTIANWFQENCIFGTASIQPKYSPEFWSNHELNVMQIPRTHDAAEGWHHKINALIDKPHTKSYLLIQELIKETISNTREIEKILHRPSKPKKRKYLDNDERINRILQNKQEYSEVDLLKAIGLCIQL